MTTKKINKEWQDKTPLLDELIIKDKPLQLPNQDPILREYVLGGPDSCRDVRFVIDIETLEVLLDIAKQSSTLRAMIPGAGIKMKVCRANSGHIYEVLQIVGGMPVPEKRGNELNLNIAPSDYLIDSVGKQWKK